MRKVFCYLIVLLEIFLFTACQATPDNEIIKYSSETQYEAAPVSKNENDSVLSKVPKHLEGSFSEYGGRLEITIDADVETESKNSWPVYRTKLYYFMQEDVDQFVTGLFEPDAVFYDNIHAEMSKWDYMQEIKREQKIIEEINNGSKEYREDVDYYQRRISDMERAVSSAPENTEKEISEPLIRQIYKEDPNFFYMDVYSISDSGRRKCLFVSDERPYGALLKYADTDDPMLPVGMKYDKLIASDTVIEDIEKSEETAVAEAEAFLENLGIEGMAFSGTIRPYGTLEDFMSSTYYHDAHGVVFTRVYNDMPRALAEDDYVVVDIREDELGQYTMSMANESLTVVVNADGPVEIWWENPDEIIRVENENVQLLNFEKIEAALHDALKVRYAFQEDAEGVKQINITKVKLNYAKIHIKNNFTEHRIVPTWFFYNEKDEVVLMINATDMSTIAS